MKTDVIFITRSSMLIQKILCVLLYIMLHDSCAELLSFLY